MTTPDGKRKEAQQPTAEPPGALARIVSTKTHDLDHVELHALMIEFWARLQRGDSVKASEEMVTLGDAIAEKLANDLDVHANRFSRQRAADLFAMFQLDLAAPRPPIAGAAYLDLGCGAINPYGMGMLMCMLGATRCFGVDLDKILDVPRALRGLARLCDSLLKNPAGIVRNYPITRQQIDENLRGIDVEALRKGRAEGLGTRLRFLEESAAKISVDAGSIDVVMSNSFLEHIADLGSVLDELARVTKKGGFGVHAIDGVDHRSYFDPKADPHGFLREPGTGMVRGSNRIRVLAFPALFEKHGFSVQQVIPRRRLPLTPEAIAQFAPPWSTMSREMLETVLVTVVVRKN